MSAWTISSLCFFNHFELDKGDMTNPKRLSTDFIVNLYLLYDFFTYFIARKVAKTMFPYLFPQNTNGNEKIITQAYCKSSKLNDTADQ